MAIPLVTLKAYEKTRVDHAIDAFASLETPSASDLNHVMMHGDIQCKIDEYRYGAMKMDDDSLRCEKHSRRKLARHMGYSDDPRPHSRCDCHAIISGNIKNATGLRAIMAWCMMRIDDPRNGCWLPRTKEDRPHMPSWLRNAVPHQRVHRESYYRWLSTIIKPSSIKGMDDLITALKMVRMRLQSGSLPPEILREMGV